MTNEEKTHLTVRVAEKNYQLSGIKDATHYTLVAQYVDDRIKEIRLATPQLDQEGTAIACALSIADELLHQRRVNARLRRESENVKSNATTP